VRLTWLVFTAMISFGCGRTEVVRYSIDPPDAGRPDAGRDAGPPDAGPPDAGPPDAGPCVPRPVPLVPAVPTVLFVIDRSGSMLEDLDGRVDAGAQSRWRVLESTLTAVLPPLDQQIAMGALMYPEPLAICAPPSGVNLSPARGNARALLNLFRPEPEGGTPTSGALSVAAVHLRTLHTANSAKAVILATDGAPNCNFNLTADSCVCTLPPIPGVPNCPGSQHCLDDTRTINELRNLFSMGLPTYVIGLGSQLNQFASTLDQMAVAGGVPRMGIGARYYSVGNQSELADAFNRITAQLTRCTFLLNGLSANDTFVLQVGGVDVPQGPNGWEWLDQANGELALHGMACDRAAGGATASVLVDCH
jgi:hypothetical protein